MTTSTSRSRPFGIDELVTSEAVAVETPVAGLLHRCASGAIDVALSVLLYCLGGLATVLGLGAVSDAVGQTVMILVLVGALVAIPVALETMTRGRTVGKLALGLRTVRDDGGPIRFRHAFVRGLIGFVEIYVTMGLPAFVTSLVHPKGKRLGDLAAGTHVITTRTRARLSPPPPMPPPLAAWASGADIGALPEGLGIAVRQYLTRRADLSPAARDQLGRQLLEAVLEQVSPLPPRAYQDEVLAAVLAERRRRDDARLRRDQALRDRVIGADILR